jgi:hypothetical protein
LTNGADADGEVVWSWRLDAGVKLAEEDFRRWRWQESPITGESTKETVKTIAQGRPDISGKPVVTTLVCFVLFRTRGCGCGGHPAFPAPSVFLGERILHRSGVSRRGNAESCPGCLKIEFFTLSRTSEHSERDPGP